jgi:metacaspase-1
MKKLTFIFMLFGVVASFAQENNKVALIFALSQYNPDTKWPDINSMNDVPIIQDALKQRGYEDKNIHIYQNQLNKQGMIDAIRKHLIEGIKPGDIVYFQYSGHGQQIATNTPELEADGLDEALVPVDAPSSNKIMINGKEEPYKFDKHLRDKELRDLLVEVREKLGPKGNLFVVIDACHSGGATRGFGIHRGSASPNVPEGWKPPQVRLLASNTGFAIGNRDEKLAPMAVFSASGPHQLNFEYRHEEDNKNYGSLSYALANALLETDHKVSYKSLFELVKNKMLTIAPRQNPVAEGELDQEIMGGQLLPKSNYFTGKRINDKEWEINAGQLMSVFEGAVIGFYPPDTREEDMAQTKPWAEGKVISAKSVTARVEITDGTLTTKQVPWIYVTQKTFGGINLKYKLIANNQTFIEAWEKAIRPYSFLEKRGDNNVDLIIEYDTDFSGKNKLLISTVNEIRLFENSIDPKGADHLFLTGVQQGIDKIKTYGQAAFIKQLTSTPNNFRVSQEVVAYRFKKLPISASYEEIEAYLSLLLENESDIESELLEIPSEMIKNEGGDYVIPEGTMLTLKMHNQSARNIYYSLLHISPANEITSVFPNEDQFAPSEFRIGGNKTEVSGMLMLTPPNGTDIYKFFYSTRELNLMRTVNTRGRGEPAPENSVESFLQESYKSEGLSRSAPVRVGNQNGDLLSIQNLIIQIAPAGQFLGVN